MFLSADDICSEIESGRLVIEPFNRDFLKPASYVLRISNRWRRWKKQEQSILLWSADAAAKHLEPVTNSNCFEIQSLAFALTETIERICLPDDILGVLSTLSHLARFGLSVHMNSFFVNPGFGRNRPTAIALELFSANPSPILVVSGTPACHLAFVRTSGRAKLKGSLMKSIYDGADALASPRLYEEFSCLMSADTKPNSQPDE